jgi:glycosyltransferase involved in cell wall biosynthesis
VNKKVKVLVLADHPMAPSGVGTQTRYFCEALLKTGRYSIVCLGGAVKHQDYNPQQVEGWGEDWKIFPVNGYGTPEIVRSVLRTEKPDVLWFMTDPRFFEWLWSVDNEVRSLIPMVYYHVWDNYPPPMFNRNHYLSNDLIVAISKVTDDIVSKVAPEVDRVYHPHAVDSMVFRPLPDINIAMFKKENMSQMGDKFIFFWNNRNARRKQSGSLLWWFNDFLDRVGRDKACLLMHTDPKDVNGQDLEAIVSHLELNHGQVFLSKQKVPPEHLSMLYNAADCTINISDAEGFGLATLESLSCGTPIIVNMTGGLQEQITDGEEWFGVPIFPSSKAVIGSQQVPYIFEDRIDRNQFVSALTKMYESKADIRKQMGLAGRKYVEKNYNFKNYQKNWVKIIDDLHEKNGSWENRKNYNNINFVEVK